MNFMDAIAKTLQKETDISVTENGATGFKSSGRKLLDLNFAVSSLRGYSDRDIIERWEEVYAEDPDYAIKWLCFARDIRGGMGERRLFRVILRWLACNDLEIVTLLTIYGDDYRGAYFIHEYGRWDDLFSLMDTPGEDIAYYVVGININLDLLLMQREEPISLLAKWMPSITSKNEATRTLARKFARKLKWSEETYRKNISALRKYLDVVERKMSAREWEAIDYEKVPSKANLIYKNAFLKHDKERRRSYLDKLEKGEAKINSSTLYPYEIINQFEACNGDDQVRQLEAMWKSLPNYLDKSDERILVIRDGSGSMLSRVNDIKAINIATSLAIYFAERIYGEFHDKFITFSSKPEIVDMSSVEGLKNRVDYCATFNDYTNTDLEATFQLILKTAVDKHLSQEDLPSILLIVSDMEFDSAIWGNPFDATLFDSIKNMYEHYGYKIPRLVFWNVFSRSETIPVKENELGVALVSGFSPSITDLILSGKADPYEALIDKLDSERYDKINLALDVRKNFRETNRYIGGCKLIEDRAKNKARLNVEILNVE